MWAVSRTVRPLDRETTINLDLPPVIEPAGPWERPKPEMLDGLAIQSGSFICRHRLRLKPGTTTPKVVIGCKLGFQACDPIRCLAPTTWTLSTSLAVTP